MIFKGDIKIQQLIYDVQYNDFCDVLNNTCNHLNLSNQYISQTSGASEDEVYNWRRGISKPHLNIQKNVRETLLLKLVDYI